MNIKKQLNDLNKQYYKDVEGVAQQAFEEIIKPWLVRNHYRFSSGMGTWAVFFGDHYIYRDDLPRYILDILEIQIGVNELGEFLRDFDPSDKGV